MGDLLALLRAGEDLVLELRQLLLETVDDREVMIDDEIHDRIQNEPWALPEVFAGCLAAGAHLAVRQRSAVPDRDDVARPDEHVRLPELDLVLLGIGLRRAQHDEQRLPVLLDLRALVGAMRVLDGQIVEPELRLDLPQELFVRLVQTNPDEAVGLLQNLAGLLERDLADTTAARVRHAVDDAGGVHVDAIARS